MDCGGKWLPAAIEWDAVESVSIRSNDVSFHRSTTDSVPSQLGIAAGLKSGVGKIIWKLR
jgi:hypothetical protein